MPPSQRSGKDNKADPDHHETCARVSAGRRLRGRARRFDCQRTATPAERWDCKRAWWCCAGAVLLLTPPRPPQVHQLFRLFDHDRDHALSKAQFGEALEWMGMLQSDEALATMSALFRRCELLRQ